MTLNYDPMRLLGRALCLCLSLSLSLSLAAEAGTEYDPRTCRGTSLHPKSTWPNDHGDSSRSKYTLGAGLPANVAPEDIHRIDNLDVGNAQWIYTGGEDAEFVYALGPSSAAYFAKFDSKTLEVLQKIDLGTCLYLGGALVHANGHIYMVHSNRLYRFWLGDLYNATSFDIPTNFDTLMTQTNGMLVTHDGQLVVKQWPLVLRDMNFFFHGKPAILYTLMAISATICITRLAKTPVDQKNVQGMTMRHAVSLVYCFIVSVLILSVILGKLAHGPFDVVRFFTNNYLQGEVGEVKLIDPDSLEITAALTLPERASFARMALTTSRLGEEDTLVLLGDEFVHQVRWNSRSRELKYVPGWSQRYRTEGDGSFPGTGPAIFNNTAFFTDNTFPVALSGHSYKMFSRALDDFRDEPLLVAPLTAPDSPPGFMFWSTTVSPFQQDVLVWDIRGRSVQARRASDLSLHWEVKSLNADCLTVAADKKHVYFSDFNVVPGENINAFIPWMKTVKDVTKFLIVAHSETGQVLVNITIAREDGIGPSLIVPGAHNDVFIGTSKGISRLYV